MFLMTGFKWFVYQLADHQEAASSGLCAWARTRDRPPKAEEKFSKYGSVRREKKAFSYQQSAVSKIGKAES